MAQSDNYLEILSGVMLEDRAENDHESYNKLYALINNELSNQLKNASYPSSPMLMKKANRMLDDMESLFICNDLIGKACLLLSNHYTNKLFIIFGNAFVDFSFVKSLSRISTQIPFIVTNGDENTIEALNYANHRISLSKEDYQLLVKQSGEYHIALNKIIHAFIIHTPLKREDACLIFDNIYGAAKHRFSRAICKQVIYFDEKRLEELPKRGLPVCDAVTCSANLEEKLSSSVHCPLVKQIELENYLNNSVFPIFYGFNEEFLAIKVEIESYYEDAINQAETDRNSIKGDITKIKMLGDQDYLTLEAFSNYLVEQEESFKEERDKIKKILKKAEESVTQVATQLHDISSSEKVVPHRVYDDLFSALFASYKNDELNRNKIHRKLTVLGYSECELVDEYLKARPNISYKHIKKDEWEKAKMYIAIAALDKLSPELIQEYVSAIPASRLKTGKEYYAKFLVSNGDVKVLQESFDRGYEPAGEALLTLYKAGDHRVNLKTLANALVPEACVMIADQKKIISLYNNNKLKLSSDQFTFYKIAASKDHFPAIEIIADRIYQCYFSDARQLYGNQLTDQRNLPKIEYGHILCQLCSHLIEKEYKVMHIREIKGVVLFCLNENLSEAMSLLGGIDTGIANFCKGNMYEFGNGVSMNISDAINHYQKALDSSDELSDSLKERIEKRIQKCNSKKERQETNRNYYQAENTYHQTISNYSRSSSPCVITTAACHALNAADDCEELHLLRWFRDMHLQNTVEGEAIVYEYYRVGFLITHAIDNTNNANEIYRYLWDQYILPSCDAIRAEKWDAAKSIYVQMVKWLCEKFDISIQPQIKEALKKWKIEKTDDCYTTKNKNTFQYIMCSSK